MFRLPFSGRGLTQGYLPLRTQLLYLLLVLGLCFLSVQSLYAVYELRQRIALANDEEARMQSSLAAAWDLQLAAGFGFLQDYSAWGPMAEYARRPQREWIEEGLQNTLNSAKIDYLWVLSANGALVYSASRHGREKLLPNAWHPPRTQHRFHFYHADPDESIIVQGMAIHHQSEPGVRQSGQGWLIIAKRPAQFGLPILGSLLGANAKITLGPHQHKEGLSQRGYIHASIELPTLPGESPVYLNGHTYIASLEQAYKTTVYGLVGSSLAIVSLIYILLTLLKHWVTSPLALLARAMTGHDPQPLRVVSRGNGELARLALVTRVFLAQKQLLLRQVEATQNALTQLAHANAQLAASARTDALTGLANRRRLDEYLGDMGHACQREEESIALILFDLDHFKGYNDTLGHLAGDQCLQTLAALSRETVRRQVDLLARYGGEEFAVVVPFATLMEAEQLAQSLCRHIATASIAHPASPLGIVTVSVGVAALIPKDDHDMQQLLKDADSALYAAKAAGRNQVCRHTPSEPNN